jgi:hypothetical protein
MASLKRPQEPTPAVCPNPADNQPSFLLLDLTTHKKPTTTPQPNTESPRTEEQFLERVMTGDDAAFSRIANGEIPPRGMSDSRFQEYKKVYWFTGVERRIAFLGHREPEGIRRCL